MTAKSAELATEPVLKLGEHNVQGIKRPLGRRLLRFLESYALLVLLVVMVIFFSVWPQTSGVFLTPANLQILVASQAVLGVVALTIYALLRRFRPAADSVHVRELRREEASKAHASAPAKVFPRNTLIEL